MQLISVTSSRLNLSTPAHLPDLSFCWFSQRWVPHRHQRNQSHYVSSAHAWLGAALNLATVKDGMHFTLQPKESSGTQVIQGCHLAIARGSLTPAEASTLRGQAGWTTTLSAGRFGRIGMRVLKERQYQSPSVRSSLDEHDVQKLQFLSSVISVAPPLLCISADLPVFLVASIRMHPTQRECAPALDGCCLTTMLSLLWVTGTTSLRFCCTTGSSHIPSWQQKPLPSLQQFGNTETSLLEKMSSSLQTPSCRQRHDRGDSRLPVVGTMAMCVQLLMIRYKIAIWFEWVDSNSNLADGLSKMVRKLLGHWISFGNYTNSKAFLSQSHWFRCENNSFQNLLTIDQSDQLEYVRRLVPCLSVRCLGPIVEEFEHSFSLASVLCLRFEISPHHIVTLCQSVLGNHVSESSYITVFSCASKVCTQSRSGLLLIFLVS